MRRRSGGGSSKVLIFLLGLGVIYMFINRVENERECPSGTFYNNEFCQCNPEHENNEKYREFTKDDVDVNIKIRNPFYCDLCIVKGLYEEKCPNDENIYTFKLRQGKSSGATVISHDNQCMVVDIDDEIYFEDDSEDNCVDWLFKPVENETYYTICLLSNKMECLASDAENDNIVGLHKVDEVDAEQYNYHWLPEIQYVKE